MDMIQSPFLYQLNSNYAAEEADLPQLESVITKSVAELERIRLEMERIHKVYMDLGNQHEDLLNYIEAHRALLAPVRRLPVEVLQEIFRFCLPSTAQERVLGAKSAPVLLTHICGRWRRIAIDTPWLWSSIHIVLPRPKLVQGPSQTHNWTLRAVAEWFSRSESLPLDISILDPDTRFSVTDPLSDTIIDLVLSNCYRWRSLSLNIPARFLDNYFVDLQTEFVPLLQHLSIREAYTLWRGEVTGSMRPGPPWKNAGIISAPKLSSISMSYSSADLRKEKFTQLPLRWSRLTSLDLHVSDGATPQISSIALISTLAQCNSLMACSLQSKAQRDWTLQDNELIYSGPKVLLPHLEYLSIEGIAEEFAPLMEELETPALKTLSLLVQITKDTNTRYRSAVTSLLDECAPNLSALTIAPVTIPSASFVTLLGSLWNLQILHLLGRAWTPSFDNATTPIQPSATRRDGFTIDSYLFDLLPGRYWLQQSDKTVLLPNLEVFICNMLGEGHVNDADLVGFVMSRRPTPVGNKVTLTSVPIRRVTIELNRPKDISWTTLKGKLRPYVNSGCKISIKYLDHEG